MITSFSQWAWVLPYNDVVPEYCNLIVVQRSASWRASRHVHHRVTYGAGMQREQGLCNENWMLGGNYCALQCNRCQCWSVYPTPSPPPQPSPQPSPPPPPQCSDTPPPFAFLPCDALVSSSQLCIPLWGGWEACHCCCMCHCFPTRMHGKLTFVAACAIVFPSRGWDACHACNVCHNSSLKCPETMPFFAPDLSGSLLLMLPVPLILP
jgi:hypothetical protein